MGPACCTFCDIVARRGPAHIRYEDEEVLVFDNELDWVPVMLLLIPKQHLSQDELWTSGELFAKMGVLAVELGNKHCPNGFRILSNFGHDALQTQLHGHLHIIGGTELGIYVRRPAW